MESSSRYCHALGQFKFLNFDFEDMTVEDETWLDPWSTEHRS